MKLVRRNIESILILVILFLLTSTRIVLSQENVFLFPDRVSCVSGDTIWFYVKIIPGKDALLSNVAHVQLDGQNNNHINKVSVLCDNNWANGYIIVPDSLSSGTYSLKAFTYQQAKSQGAKIFQKYLVVYNRFERKLDQIGSFTQNLQKILLPGFKGIEIYTNGETFKQRERINLKVQIPEQLKSSIASLIVQAKLTDPLSEELISSYSVENDFYISTAGSFYTENNGILLSGRVYSKSNSTVSGAIVLLSIADSIPYFDYCVSDDNGGFLFFLKEAYGSGNVILQAVTNNKEECKIQLSGHFIEVRNPAPQEEKVLTIEQKQSIEKLVDASYYNRLFNGYTFGLGDYISIPKSLIPFYGKPSSTIYPQLFIDLPDFTEISRELLHGVQYRNKKDSVTIRVGNFERNTFFNEEPFKLLDGIPVFDPDIFSSMGTNDISRVDEVFRERYFGDLVFKGVLAVYSKDSTLSWVDNNSSVNKYYCNLIQNKKLRQSSYSVSTNKISAPDYRQVLYNNAIFDLHDSIELQFQTSDLKGEVTISITGVSTDNKLFYINKKVEVK